MLEPTDNTIQAGCLGNLNARLVFHGDERALGAAVARRQRDHARGRGTRAARAARAARRRDPGARVSRGAERHADRRRHRDERDPCARRRRRSTSATRRTELRRRPRRACASSSTEQASSSCSGTRRRVASRPRRRSCRRCATPATSRVAAEAGVDARRGVLGTGPRRRQPRARCDALRAHARRAGRDRGASARRTTRCCASPLRWLRDGAVTRCSRRSRRIRSSGSTRRRQPRVHEGSS